MPNVPRAPGVPALSSFSVGPIILLLEDLILPGLFASDDVWGVYLDSVEAVSANSVVRFDYRQDWSISDYPVEEGAFQSYDKVQLPFDARLRVTSGPTAADRQRLIEDMDFVGNSTELFNIVTPEKIFLDVNCSHVDYSRTAQNGAGMITADVWFTEVRVQAATQFSNTQQPMEAGNQNGGNVQPQTPPQSVFAPNTSFF